MKLPLPIDPGSYFKPFILFSNLSSFSSQKNDKSAFESESAFAMAIMKSYVSATILNFFGNMCRG